MAEAEQVIYFEICEIYKNIAVTRMVTVVYKGICCGLHVCVRLNSYLRILTSPRSVDILQENEGKLRETLELR